MGQRENVNQRELLAPATAAPAKAAGTQALVQLHSTPGGGERGQIHPSCTAQGKHQTIQQDSGGAVPGAARLPCRSVVPAAGSGHTLGSPWAAPAPASAQGELPHKGLLPSSAVLSAISFKPNHFISFPFLPVPLISKLI